MYGINHVYVPWEYPWFHLTCKTQHIIIIIIIRYFDNFGHLPKYYPGVNYFAKIFSLQNFVSYGSFSYLFAIPSRISQIFTQYS